MSDLSRYRQWLVDQGYQPTTIAATLRHLQVVADNPEEVGYRAPHVRRYLLYVEAEECHPLGKRFTRHMTTGHGLQAVSKARKINGGNTKKLLDGGQWYMLHQTLRKGGDLDKLILAYMMSPYRIRQFLHMRIKDVNEATVQRIQSRTWIDKRCPNPRGKKMYQILCPSVSCAYSRMRRRLIAVAKNLAFEADLDTLHKTFHKRAEDPKKC